ncbi:unnamed protein product [Nippostrongylus brasiliensis]|uniref:Zinc transporter n=1 Tax=Nippostrongylus brasiliensis TaxID=27835 RepID=A0A0N4YH16_NIPBR|nr:unnamed protein product [Nippostrongylus brasiliensis]
MRPLSQSWYYWAMVALLIAQVFLSINYHILICNMPIANTLLLLVIMAHHGYSLGDQARPLFHRICGCVAFIAVLFVNTTHALELLTDYSNGDEDHGHSHGDEDHDPEKHGFGFVPKQYVIVSVFDVALKCLVLALGHIPSMGLRPLQRLVLHTLSPLVVIAMYVAGLAIPPSIGKTWLWQHVDPVVAVTMTVLFFMLIIPAFKEMMPYIFADTPAKFHVESFQDEISSTFPDVTCTHIHAYRLWPGNLFEALIHLNFLVDKSKPDWSEVAAARYSEVRQNVASVLTRAGAQKIILITYGIVLVVVEPCFLDATEIGRPWVGCVGTSCLRQDRGCCKMENDSDTAVAQC